MCSWRECAAAVALCFAAAAQAQTAVYPGIGRAATAAEIAAWDIDVRPDFTGLPAGSGSVARGLQVWDAQCASCHGVFGESNEVFAPIVGGTTAEDIAAGRVTRLTDAGFPGRTTLMKLSSVSTLWDYIRRAMPWTQPKSLSTEEVYAVTAYILHMGGIVDGDFVLSDRNIAQVQALLPNRHGMTRDHALWPGGNGRRAPDVQAAACMSACAGEPEVRSSLPDHARDAHGNLAEQNRLVGAQRGADTSPRPGASARTGESSPSRTAATAATQAAAAPAAQATPAAKSEAASRAAADGAAAIGLTRRHACVACHGMGARTVGPGFREIAGKYADRADAANYLARKIKAGGAGVWGTVPMPAQALGEADARTIAQWLAEGGAR